MMLKKIFVVIAAMGAVLCRAQDISVESFSLVENDLTANTAGTMVLDQNGEKCALIKVATSQTDFMFDAGMMGVVKTIQHPGEIWLYVPAGVKRLSISHVGMETLRDWDLGMSVQKAHTYLLVLKTTKDVTLQTVTFKVTPANAVIIVESSDVNSDFEKQSLLLSNGTTSLQLPIGDYKYTATAQGYMVEEGNFKLVASAPRKVILELAQKSSAPVAVAPQPTTPIANTNSDINGPISTMPKVEQPVEYKGPDPTIGSNTSMAPPASQTFTVKGVSFRMIEIQGGTFMMGATSEQDSDAANNEKPSHSVTLSSYYVGETEVTQELWKAVMGKNPSIFNNELQNPVEYVSLKDCQEFISKLNKLTGKNFRLLTEAEWEYAARGGNRSKGYKYSGSNDIGSVAWYSENNSGNMTYRVKTKSPNELGIYDMSGNVWEWCSDWYGSYQSGSVSNPTGPSNTSFRICRGGSCFNDASYCRVSKRVYYIPSYRSRSVGLRLGL